MNSKTIIFLSITLVVIMPLSTFMEAAPVIAEDTRDREAFGGTPVYDEKNPKSGAEECELPLGVLCKNSTYENTNDEAVYGVESVTGCEIKYDDGIAEGGKSWGTTGYYGFGVLFTNTCPSDTLETARFYIPDEPTQFRWEIRGWPGGTGPGGHLIASGTTTATITGWHDVDVSVKVPTHFVIAIMYTVPRKPRLGDDWSSPDDRSLVCEAGWWSPYFGGDFMIRAVMKEPEPDLVITDAWYDNSIIYYKIRNMGDLTAGASNTSLFIDDVFTASDSVASLEPGEVRSGSFDYTWNCSNLSDMIKVCADYWNDVNESNETNNCRAETWSCADINVSPTLFDVRLPPDTVLNYTLTIYNNGTGSLVFSIATEFSEKIFADTLLKKSRGLGGMNLVGVPSQPGWPQTTGDNVDSSPALGDIDGDGDVEVVVGSWDDKVYAWHHDGLLVAGWPQTAGSDVYSSPALGDIDGDGDIEVVVGSRYKVHAWHHDGLLVAGWPQTTGSTVDSSPALGDIDGDGDIEAVVGSRDDKVYAWHHDGSLVAGWPQTTGSAVYSSPALGDIDGDGDIEAVVGSNDKKVHAWHHNGSDVTGWPKTTGSYVSSSPALGDIDGDGDLEVVVGSSDDKVHAWHHNGSDVTGWPQTTGSTVDSSPALGDIDGDGDIEVVVGSSDDKVHAWHHNGALVTGWPKTTGGGVSSSPALGDIDGDGDLEIMVGSRDDKVYAWHHDGSLVAGWPQTTGYYVESSPALGDIDGDGDIEVVVGSWDDKVYVWDCSGFYNPSNIEWGTFHHDVRRTGLYEAMPSKKLDWLSVYPTNGIVNPDDQTNIAVTFNTTGLDFGQYYANITISSNDPDEEIVKIPVHLKVSDPYTNIDVGVSSNITIANSSDLAAYLPPEYDGMDISDAVVLNVDVADETPGNPADDAYTDITINVGEMNIATCKVFKADMGFLPEVDDVTTRPTVDGEPAFSRDLVNETVTIRLYVGDPLLGVIPAAGFELELAEGYNMISIPLNDSSVITASDLAAKIGTSCTEVVKWDSNTQSYISHIPGLPLNNFATTAGEGYFVNVNNPTSLTFEGPGWDSPCIISLVSGYNMIGVPVNDSSVTTASTLATKIGTSCTEVVRWDGNTQSYISHIPGLPLNDFAIMGGHGYFVNVNNPIDVSFEGVKWED
jgi:hypothetical protein